MIKHKSSSQLPASILFAMDDTVVDTHKASHLAWGEVAKRVAHKLSLDQSKLMDAFLTADAWYWKDSARADWGRLNQAGARTLISRRAFQQLDRHDDGMSK